MIFVISAPSGAGKTTLINRLLKSEKRFMFSVSTTTRSMRGGEIDGVDYNFVTREKFLEMLRNEEFLEWAEVYGNYYGTTIKEVDRIKKSGKFPFFDVDIQGSRSLREKLPEAVFVFIIPPSPEVLRSRLEGRQTDTREQIELRLKTAAEEISEYRYFDYVIINKNLEKAFARLESIVAAEQCKMKNVKNEIEEILEEFNDYTTR
jgi:guanylate kinase